MGSPNTSIAPNYVVINSIDDQPQLVLNGISLGVFGILITNNQIAGNHTIDFYERDGTTLIYHLRYRNSVTVEMSKYFEAVNGLSVAFNAPGGDGTFSSCTIFYSTLV